MQSMNHKALNTAEIMLSQQISVTQTSCLVLTVPMPILEVAREGTEWQAVHVTTVACASNYAQYKYMRSDLGT